MQIDGWYKKIRACTLCWTEGLDEIETEIECKNAAEILGLEWGFSRNMPNDFPGCFESEDINGWKLVLFNTSPNPSRTHLKSNSAAICKSNKFMIILFYKDRYFNPYYI